MISKNSFNTGWGDDLGQITTPPRQALNYGVLAGFLQQINNNSEPVDRPCLLSR